MRQTNGRLMYSPSDLSAFLACPHLTSLQVAVARGELAKPYRHNPHAELIRRKGDEHEHAVLAALEGVVEIGLDGGWEAAVRATEEAIRGGASVVYQATFEHDRWRGRADFLQRRADGSYEVLDTKLARHARPQHVLQLCFYTEQVARIQGRMPAAMHVVTGARETETFRPHDYLAYYRRLKRRFAETVAAGEPTYPYPVEFCGLCEFLARCREQWEQDDHLTLVAGLSRLQFERLTDHGITTLERLGEAGGDDRPSRIRPAPFDRLRHQAALQLRGRREERLLHDLLPVEEDRGFALLPEPSPGDVWLDLEGHPWFEPARGLEYLFGWVYLEEGRPVYRCEWAFDRDGERGAFERFVDWIVERRRRFPELHVYHYAAYERSALTRLMGFHGTREDEIDDLLRGEVLVDLYRVVRQALRASVESYSIKEVEKLYEFERRADVSGGTESVVQFERYQELRDSSLLDGIRDYNADDCLSTYELHRWLLEQRPAEVQWRKPPEEREPPDEEVAERLREREELRRRLLVDAEEAEPHWLLAHLLEYHRREARPQWWEYFHHLGLDEDELFRDTDCIAEIELAGEPVRDKQSLVYTLSFPAQEHKISGQCVDPATERGWDAKVDDAYGLITLRRRAKDADQPLPRALIPSEPFRTTVQREAVLRFALDYERGGGRFPALRDVLERNPPRARLDGTPVEAALSLDSSYLFVQGPPGSGKTWNGSRMAIALMRAGKRVGITALSHKAIHKFLEAVRDAAREEGFTFKGRKKGDGDDVYRDEFVDCTGDNAEMLDEELQLVAGTSWLFSREELQGHVDTLFVDEAGQFALADTLAVGTAARDLILLGDPNQLPQVSQGTHPPGASASVLGHLLGDDETAQPDMGLFLEQTWRLRPEVCSFISDTFYEGRLHPAPPARGRLLGDGQGVRFLPVDHRGNQQRSREEAEVVRAEIDRLVGSGYVDERGRRRLAYGDVIVVAPYNAHVRCLREALPEAVRVGTVDKFQGQEAPVVFYAMASSSADDVPRGLDFLFSRNRLNVAISRAKCLAYLVASPRLLDANCRTVEQMRLANALCRLVEVAAAATARV
jgi:predicted RecB family nuclease